MDGWRSAARANLALVLAMHDDDEQRARSAARANLALVLSMHDDDERAWGCQANTATLPHQHRHTCIHTVHTSIATSLHAAIHRYTTTPLHRHTPTHLHTYTPTRLNLLLSVGLGAWANRSLGAALLLQVFHVLRQLLNRHRAASSGYPKSRHHIESLKTYLKRYGKERKNEVSSSNQLQHEIACDLQQNSNAADFRQPNRWNQRQNQLRRTL